MFFFFFLMQVNCIWFLKITNYSCDYQYNQYKYGFPEIAKQCIKSKLLYNRFIRVYHYLHTLLCGVKQTI